MKKLFALLALLPAMASAQCNVYFSLRDFGLDPLSSNTVRMIATNSTPAVSGTNIIVNDWKQYRTSTNGFVTFTNCRAYAYHVLISGPNSTTPYKIQGLPTDGSTVNGADYLVPVVSPSITSYLTAGTNIYLKTNSGVLSINFSGTNALLTNVTLHATSNASPVNALGQTSDGKVVKIAVSSGSGDAGGTNARQFGTLAGSNIVGLASFLFTNVPAGGSNISLRTVGGTNFFDTTGQLNNWAQVGTNDVQNFASNRVMEVHGPQIAGLSNATASLEMVNVTTDNATEPTTTLLTLRGSQNAIRIWTGEQSVAEPYFDLYVRTNSANTVPVRLYRWQGRIIKLPALSTVQLGTTNGRPLTVSAMTVVESLSTPSGVTNYVSTDQAGPPYWSPSSAHVVLSSNGMTFMILTNRKETPVFVSEFDGERWSPLRWYITETNASLTVQCTYRRVAMATYNGDTLRIVAPVGSSVGGVSTRMSIASVSGGRRFHVSTSSNLLHAITNAIAGDVIWIADGVYTHSGSIVAGSFATNQALGYKGSEGITFRGASGNRSGPILEGCFNIVNLGATLPDVWRDITFDFRGSTNIWRRADGRVICENVRWQNNTGSDLAAFESTTGDIFADLLWCSAESGYDDVINVSGSAASMVRLIGCDAAFTTAGTASQIVTSHGGTPVEIYGGYYSDSRQNVWASSDDASPIWAFFSTVTAGTNFSGVANASLFGCVVRNDDQVLNVNTNGYILFSELARNLSANVGATYRSYDHNRIKTTTYAAQPRRGNWSWVGNIFFSSAATAFRVVDFSSEAGPTRWVGNTVYSASTAWSFQNVNLTGRLTNNASLNSGVSMEVTIAAGLVLGDYNTLDPTLDANYGSGANDITSGNAALDARWIPSAGGNCDTNGAYFGHIGDSDPYGHVWIYGPTLVSRGARARAISNGTIFPDVW